MLEAVLHCVPVRLTEWQLLEGTAMGEGAFSNGDLALQGLTFQIVQEWPNFQDTPQKDVDMRPNLGASPKPPFKRYTSR